MAKTNKTDKWEYTTAKNVNDELRRCKGGAHASKHLKKALAKQQLRQQLDELSM